jgi:hypothetical protein
MQDWTGSSFFNPGKSRLKRYNKALWGGSAAQEIYRLPELQAF